MKIIEEVDPPKNIGLVFVTFNRHISAQKAPIEVAAGCSWASLDAEGVDTLIAELQNALRALAEHQSPF